MEWLRRGVLETLRPPYLPRRYEIWVPAFAGMSGGE